MKNISLLLLATVILMALSMHSTPRAHAATPAASSTDADTIRALEIAMMQAGEEKGADGYVSFYADDAVELPDSLPAIQGKTNIRKTMSFLDDKNNRLTWAPAKVDVAASGDLAYSYGTYEFRTKDANGHSGLETGKYTSIWKKQSDSQWKVVLDMGNTSTRL